MPLEQVSVSSSFGAGERKPHFHSNAMKRRPTVRLSVSSIQTLMFGTWGNQMLIARVIGNIVATQKNQRYEGTRIMHCRQITPDGDDMDYTCIALDSVNAGE